MNRDHGAFQADGRSNWERMIAGDWYIGDDPKMSEVSRRAQRLLKLYEAALPEDPDIAHYLLEQILGSVGRRVTIRPPFRVDYGINIHIGEGVWANYGLTALDVAEIRIGNDVLIGPNCQLLTPIHPLEHAPRREGWESAEPIIIEDNVWLASGVTVCQGVTIGHDSVVGAGAVVTRSIPPRSLAVGNPARVIRELRDDDNRQLALDTSD